MIFKQIVFLAVLLCSTIVNAQEKDKAGIVADTTGRVEVMPAFNGSINGWLTQHIQYPASAKNASIEGRVIVKFIIDPLGVVGNVTVFKSSGVNVLDEEAVRVISQMPLWKPGMQNGVPVKVFFTFPITFTVDMTETQRRADLKAHPAPNMDSSGQYCLYAYDSSGIGYVNRVIKSPFMMELGLWLRNNLNDPSATRQNQEEGKAMVGFEIDAQGHVTTAEILETSGNSALDWEALRLIKATPQWPIASSGGKLVPVDLVMPIRFRMH